MSGDAEQEYFADGIAEDIITALSKSRWLFVIARNSSFTYKGRTVDIKQIGRELGVRYVLEGSVRKSGNRARITAQLIEASTGAHMWAERYDRDLVDIFVVQDEITGSVASAIEPAMAQAEQQRVSRKLPDSLDAWEAYHRGLWHLVKLEPSENDQARPFFQRAIDLDRGFARILRSGHDPHLGRRGFRHATITSISGRCISVGATSGKSGQLQLHGPLSHGQLVLLFWR